MKNFFLNLAAFVAGVLTFMCTLGGLEALIPVVLYLPPTPSQAADMGQYIADIPLGPKLAIELSFLIAGFFGGYVTTWVAPKQATPWPTLAVALVATAGAVFNFIQIPHPAWMVAVGLLACAAMPFMGYLVRK